MHEFYLSWTSCLSIVLPVVSLAAGSEAKGEGRPQLCLIIPIPEAKGEGRPQLCLIIPIPEAKGEGRPQLCLIIPIPEAKGEGRPLKQAAMPYLKHRWKWCTRK